MNSANDTDEDQSEGWTTAFDSMNSANDTDEDQSEDSTTARDSMNSANVTDEDVSPTCQEAQAQALNPQYPSPVDELPDRFKMDLLKIFPNETILDIVTTGNEQYRNLIYNEPDLLEKAFKAIETNNL